MVEPAVILLEQQCVSRRHAVLTAKVQDGELQLTVTDLGSKFGSFVNGKVVATCMQFPSMHGPRQRVNLCPACRSATRRRHISCSLGTCCGLVAMSVQHSGELNHSIWVFLPLFKKLIMAAECPDHSCILLLRLFQRSPERSFSRRRVELVQNS
eukprot:SAG31_NODE_2707_length_5211_cov_7.051601_1_plen_154_part_00